MPLLRILCPPAVTSQLTGVLLAAGGDDAAVSVVPGAGRPGGDDLILAELARTRVDPLLSEIRTLPGGVRVSVEPSLRLLPRSEPAEDDDAVVWAEVAHEIHAAGRLSWVNLLLMSCAAMIAAVGILTDQLLLIVGAMALSPDYYLVADTSLALSRRAWAAAARAGLTLSASFLAAVTAAWLLSEALLRLELNPPRAEGPGLTLFISRPDVLSVLVALVAGVAGGLAITLPGTRGLVGVFVSVTTIPAAANIGVALAARNPGELAGAAVQLLANVACLLIGGTLTLVVRHRGRAPRQLPSLLPLLPPPKRRPYR